MIRSHLMMMKFVLRLSIVYVDLLLRKRCPFRFLKI